MTLPAFQRRVRELLGPVVADLGEPVEGEDDLRGKLRGLLTAALAIQGADESTRARAADLLDRQEAQPGSVDPELVAAATAIVASTGDETTFERMLAGYRDALDAAGSAALPLLLGRVRHRGADPAHAASWR